MAEPSTGMVDRVAGENAYLMDVVLKLDIPVDGAAASQALEGLLVVLYVPVIPSFLLLLLDPEHVLQLLVPRLELLDALL